MRVALWTIYLWLLVAAFSTAGDWPRLPASAPWYAASIKVVEGGRLCAVSPILGYTAKHVWNTEGKTSWRRGDHDVPLQAFLFKDRDLVRVLSPEPFPAWAELAPEPPALGAELTALGPFAEEEAVVWKVDVLGPMRAWGEVLLGTAGASPAGSSGGCWFDANGRIVGVEIGTGVTKISRVDELLTPLTFIAPLWGSWAKK